MGLLLVALSAAKFLGLVAKILFFLALSMLVYSTSIDLILHIFSLLEKVNHDVFAFMVYIGVMDALRLYFSLLINLSMVSFFIRFFFRFS